MNALAWPAAVFVVTGAVCLTLQVGRRRWGPAPFWLRAGAFWLFGNGNRGARVHGSQPSDLYLLTQPVSVIE